MKNNTSVEQTGPNEFTYQGIYDMLMEIYISRAKESLNKAIVIGVWCPHLNRLAAISANYLKCECPICYSDFINKGLRNE